MVSHPFRVFGLATAIATLGGCLGQPRAARADSEPVIAIPGHLGVPVIINGIDATGAEVYGDWGLSRPGHGAIIIEGGTPIPLGPSPVRYFPTSGTLPDSGSRESKVAPPPVRAPPSNRPAASTDFHRSWSAGSNPVLMPDAPPSVIVAPPRPAHSTNGSAGSGRP